MKKETKKTEIKPKQEVKNEEAQIREIVTVIENKENEDVFGKLSRAQIDLIKRTVADGASDDELRLFIQVCKGAKLNPFMKQAHLVPFWDSKEGINRRAIIVGIDGFRAIAESGGAYAGNDDAIFEGVEKLKTDKWENKKVVGQQEIDVPKKATVSVYKVIAGQRYPFTASARWSEYYPGAKKGIRWHNMPHLMLGKCAEALALRKAFPKLLSGLYAQEEMDQVMDQEQAEKRSNQATGKLKALLSQCTAEEAKDWKNKIMKSEKYNTEQKVEIMNAANARIAELKGKIEK